jgi:excisionase family DNA binding protein
MDINLDSSNLASIPVRSVYELTSNLFEPLLNADEAAQLLGGIHPKTLQRWARLGVVPGYQISRSWHFRASELDRYLCSTVASRQANNARVN